MKRDINMKAKLTLLGLGSLMAACNAPDVPSAGVTALHVPVVSQTSYVFDMAAPGGMVGQDESDRLDKWFQSMELGYGDSIYVDGPDGAARGQVAAVAAQYGMLIREGAPVTQGAMDPGSVRVIVRRAEAHVPGCPDWSRPSQPDFNNSSLSNFGCGVNGALAAQVADANDLVRGKPGPSAEDGATASKAINMYRTWPLTGIIDGQVKRPLKKVESTARKESQR